eukprot:2670294-Pleurochrysis_carterae.AAC.1
MGQRTGVPSRTDPNLRSMHYHHMAARHESSLPSLRVGAQGWLKQLFEACAFLEKACVGVGVQGTDLDELMARRWGRR